MRCAVIIAIAVAGAAAQGARPACAGCLPATYWRVSDAFKFPESDLVETQGLDFGVAISGGGTRSAAAAVGQLRGLMQNGWLDRVRYLAAVSGGAWAAVPFVYSKATPETLLGAYEPPCRLADPSKPNGLIAKTVAGANLVPGGIREALVFGLAQESPAIKARINQELQRAGARVPQLASPFALVGQHYDDIRAAVRGRALPKGTRQDKTYARMLGERLLDPVVEPAYTLLADKLGDPRASGRTFWWTAGSLAAGSANLRDRGFPSDMLTTAPGRPYLVVGSTMVVPADEEGYPRLVPFEFTPLYSGSRVGRDGRSPGVYVSSWAFDSPLVASATEGFLAQIDEHEPFTLADVIAATGSAPELRLLLGNDVPRKYKDYEKKAGKFFPVFAPPPIEQDGNVRVTEPLSFGDGGFTDNLGVMPLLARGVHNIIVFFNTNTLLSQTSDDLRALFMPVGTPDGTGDKTHNQVFDAEQYVPIYKALLHAATDDRPQFYCTDKLRVRPNATYGIRGYDGLNLCIFYAANVRLWEDSLTAAAKSLFAHDNLKANNLDTFPLYPTQQLALSPVQVNLLGNLWSWILTRPETIAEVRRVMPILPAAPEVERCDAR